MRNLIIIIAVAAVLAILNSFFIVVNSRVSY